MNKIKSFIECSCHMDIILLMIHEIPIATLENIVATWKIFL
jgi:hypothetical protein